MKRLKNILTFTAVALMIWSCDSILDTEPQQSISEDNALTTSDNVEAVLIGAYNELGDTDLWGGQIMMNPDLLADEGDVVWSGTFEQPRQIYFKTIRVDNFDIAALWLDAYDVINIANNVLSSLDIVDADIRDRIQGEALFIRGALYFELAQVFGKSWNDGDPTQNLAVPLVTEPTRGIDSESEIPRNTVSAVYQQAIDDLTSARDLLANISPVKNGVYANTYAASAILSRVYLQQGDYSAAANAANRVIESGEFSLVSDYADVFNNSNTNTSEDIFAMQVTSQDGSNALHTFYASQDFGGRGDIEIQDQHLNKYEAGDERLDLFYSDGEGTRTGKYKNQYANISVVRLAEMYLTRAEANFQLGAGNYVGPNTPADDLNTVRNRVGLPDILTPTLQDITDERYLELAFEGRALHDKKRLQIDVGTLAWNANELVYPVPLREMNTNPALVQNEGYGN